jgi:hypothetical protein
MTQTQPEPNRPTPALLNSVLRASSRRRERQCLGLKSGALVRGLLASHSLPAGGGRGGGGGLLCARRGVAGACGAAVGGCRSVFAGWRGRGGGLGIFWGLVLWVLEQSRGWGGGLGCFQGYWLGMMAAISGSELVGCCVGLAVRALSAGDGGVWSQCSAGTFGGGVVAGGWVGLRLGRTVSGLWGWSSYWQFRDCRRVGSPAGVL